MIGLDTNVLVRYIVQDEPRQSKRASEVIDELTTESPGYVSHLVLCELVWVLDRAYNYPKDATITVVSQILSTAELVIQHPEIAWAALRDYSAHSAGFADYMIAQTAKTEGCLETLTFDSKAAKHSLFRKL